MILRVHKEHCERLELEQVANELVLGREGGMRMFGSLKFSDRHYTACTI